MSNINNKTRSHRTGLTVLKRALIATAALSAVAAGANSAFAQDDSIEIVVVTGYRAALENALNTKRMSNAMVDSINAEDVAKFPDANLAESMQRLPGVSISRENGEGRTITVRGLGADFTRVTINGMEALATSGGTLSGDNPNRSRQFDFNSFASELFSSLKVAKSASAEADEGSLGATVGLSSGKPFTMGNKFALSVTNGTYENGHAFNPRVATVMSHNWLGGRLGTLFSLAFNLRNTNRDYYTNGAGGYVYRVNNSTGAFNGTANGSAYTTRDGFSAPTGTSCSGTDGVTPGVSITNSAYCEALSGSDSSAYNTVNTTNGSYGHTMSSSGVWTSQAPSNEFGVPALGHQELYQSRIGMTGSIQWQIDDNTVFSLDGLFSSFYQKSTSNLLTAVGLSRNGTAKSLATADASTNLSTLFTACTVTTASALKAANDCSFSKASSVYDYYTSTTGGGYDASDPNGMNWLISTIGRPSTKLVSGTVSNGIVDYAQLDNVDSRTIADQTRSTTQFQQATASIERTFTQRFKANALFGMSMSHNSQEGLFASFDSLDRGTSNGDGYYTYDITGKDYALKELSFGFNTADVNNWDFIKGYSTLRRYLYETNNRFNNVTYNMQYDVLDELSLKFGFARRIYDFDTTRYVRVVDTTNIPSLSEMGIAMTDVARTVSFDASSLGLSGDTPTSFVVPDIDKFAKYTGMRCNCVNEYGDWRISNLNSAGNTGNRTTSFGVTEHDKSYYLQADFQGIMILGNELRGNIGMRYATTDVHSTGYTAAGYQVSANNDYDDMLPSLNLVYGLSDEMMFRFGMAKVMSRPTLANMSPTVSSVSISSTLGTSGSFKAGNPYLKPFRANTVDISYEWYYDRGSLISVAAFAKYVKNNPQSQTVSGKVSELLTQTMIDAINSQLDTSSIAYQNFNNADLTYTMTQYRNAPGGLLEGIELNFQQQFNFLPYPYDGFGINANYTYVHSKMHYCFQDSNSSSSSGGRCGSGLSDHIAPWTGSSPNSVNATLYYSAQTWEARVSTAFRSSYMDSYPINSGAYQVGYSASPAINEAIYGKTTMYLDFSASYTLNEYMSFKIDASNLTNQHEGKYWLYQGETKRTTYDSVGGRTIMTGFTFKY